MVEDIADSFSSYIGRGVDGGEFSADPTLEIDRLSALLELYFVLTGQTLSEDIRKRREISEPIKDVPSSWDIGVLDFVSLLPARVQELETTTQSTTVRYEGEVRGPIDWQETIKQRARSPGHGGQLFACRERQEVILTDENKVLLTLLSNIHQIVSRFEQAHSENLDEFKWFSDWFPDSHARTILQTVLRQNPYLSDLDRSSRHVPPRTLRAGFRSRNPLYREAATLLNRLQKLQAGELTTEESKELLKSRFFVPEDDDAATLFELYWAMRILDTYKNHSPQYRQVTQSRGLVAEWTTATSRYQLFRDWDGTYQDEEILSFARTASDIESEIEIYEPPKYLARTKSALDNWATYTKDLTGRSAGQFKSGRPDIVLLQFQDTSNVLKSVFLGEVKFSSDLEEVKKGIRELFEYASYAKIGRDGTHDLHQNSSPYLIPDGDPFSSPHISLGLFTEQPQLQAVPRSPQFRTYTYGDSIETPLK